MGQLFPGLATVPALHPQGTIPAYRTVPLLALRKYTSIRFEGHWRSL